jgi:hypothetical protein
MNEAPAPQPQKQNHVVAITAIIATAIVSLACIAGCTGVLITLALNNVH